VLKTQRMENGAFLGLFFVRKQKAKYAILFWKLAIKLKISFDQCGSWT